VRIRVVLNPAAGGVGDLDRTVASLLDHPLLAGAEIRITGEEDARSLAREAATSGSRGSWRRPWTRWGRPVPVPWT
jgi:diacylglycerol kinase family enzyme